VRGNSRTRCTKHLRAVTEGIKLFKLHHARREAFFAQVFEPTGRLYQREMIKGNAIVISGASMGMRSFFHHVSGSFSSLAATIHLSALRSLTGLCAYLWFLLDGSRQRHHVPDFDSQPSQYALRNIRSLGLSLDAGKL